MGWGQPTIYFRLQNSLYGNVCLSSKSLSIAVQISLVKSTKVSFFVQCIKKQLITLQNFNIETCFSQFLWFFSLKCWFKGQIISRIHLILPSEYKLICFDRNINGNRDVKFLDCDYLLVQRCVKLTLEIFLKMPKFIRKGKKVAQNAKKTAKFFLVSYFGAAKNAKFAGRI